MEHHGLNFWYRQNLLNDRFYKNTGNYVWKPQGFQVVNWGKIRVHKSSTTVPLNIASSFITSLVLRWCTSWLCKQCHQFILYCCKAKHSYTYIKGKISQDFLSLFFHQTYLPGIDSAESMILLRPKIPKAAHFLSFWPKHSLLLLEFGWIVPWKKKPFKKIFENGLSGVFTDSSELTT